MTSNAPEAAVARSRPVLRRTLDEILTSDADLDAFCQDYFPDIYREFGRGMSRKQRLTMLLDDPERVLALPQALEDERRLKGLFSAHVDTVLVTVRAFLAVHAALPETVELAAPAPSTPAPPDAEAAPSEPLPTPFRPLAPFEKEDRDLFFGRDLDAFDLAVQVRTQRLCVLHGASGTGKSSLLRAGLWPLLERDFVWFAHSPGADFHKSLRAALSVAWQPRPAEALPAEPLAALSALSGGKPLL